MTRDINKTIALQRSFATKLRALVDRHLRGIDDPVVATSIVCPPLMTSASAVIGALDPDRRDMFADISIQTFRDGVSKKAQDVH